MNPRLSQALSVALFLGVVLGWWALTDQPLWTVVVVALVTAVVITWATERSRRVSSPVPVPDAPRPDPSVGSATTSAVGVTTLWWAWGSWGGTGWGGSGDGGGHHGGGYHGGGHDGGFGGGFDGGFGGGGGDGGGGS